MLFLLESDSWFWNGRIYDPNIWITVLSLTVGLATLWCILAFSRTLISLCLNYENKKLKYLHLKQTVSVQMLSVHFTIGLFGRKNLKAVFAHPSWALR